MPTTLTPKTEIKEKRRVSRISINLPVKVAGKDSSDSTWNEITRLEDVSAFGAAFKLSRPIIRGRLVHLTLPMPRQMRCYDHMEGQYQIWAIVRRCRLIENSQNSVSYLVGTAFIGKHPPSSYFDNPANLYELKQTTGEGLWDITNAPEVRDESHLPKEDRAHSRYSIPVSLKIELLDSEGQPLKGESTVTENVSFTGASVFTSLNIEVGSFIKVTSELDEFEIKAVVRDKRTGPDGIPRLHIEFIDSYFPLKGIEL